ncbi:Atu4866 domain-containing protein [Streptomyces himalayensis]
MAYVDNPAFTATRDVRDGMLYHEHLALYRTPERQRALPRRAAAR